MRTVVLDYDAATGRALLNLGNDMRYVLDHTVNTSAHYRNTAAKYASVWKVEVPGSDSVISRTSRLPIL